MTFQRCLPAVVLAVLTLTLAGCGTAADPDAAARSAAAGTPSAHV